MSREGMFVRCPIDPEDDLYPRYFAVGKIISENDFSETNVVEFYDINNIGKFYSVPKKQEIPNKQCVHIRFRIGTKVKYNNKIYTVKSYKLNEDDYYIYSIFSDTNDLKNVSEKHITVSYTDGYVNPLLQLKTYEFQNPAWFMGRSVVSKTYNIINNSLYGFEDVAGCKIDLKTHQLRTIIRCLRDSNCRMMLADEVGMGKTIEALSILKVYLKENSNKNVSVILPDALLEQWKTEAAYKFRIFNGADSNKNMVSFVRISDLSLIDSVSSVDFIIVDEVHNILYDNDKYNILLILSERTDNILLLSATPVQNRKEEYKKLLTLIHPEKYSHMKQDMFDDLVEKQKTLIRKVHTGLECYDSLTEEIDDADGAHTEDTEDAFEDLRESLEKVKSEINDPVFNNILAEIDYDAEDFSVKKIGVLLSYVCENYQLEKSVIRNRRSEYGENDINERQLIDISYDIQTSFNNTENLLYRRLSEWLLAEKINYETFLQTYKSVIMSFFSSAHAFKIVMEKMPVEFPAEIIDLTEKWINEEDDIVNNITDYINDPDEYRCRIVNIIDYLDQECSGLKVLLFTHYKGSFQLYKRVLTEFFGLEKCTFFSSDMEEDLRELNAYRFENDNKYSFMLSDETGGEGRNFQNADIVVHIDIPFEANTVEQRIGRLDRIGRDSNKPVISVVCYSQLSIEEDLFNIWAKGLHIFEQSQSGLEIIMNEIDREIGEAFCSDILYGLSGIIDDIIPKIDNLNQLVKQERYFDVAAYQYQTINQIMEDTRTNYVENEKQLFADSMLGWASLAGFRGDKVADDVIRFDANSFSIKSAVNSLFIPPDMERLLGDKVNVIQNKVRKLNCERLIHNEGKYIVGTFDRSIAVNNDYIHFFAPSDEIYDSIVSNAISSYKGTCAAFVYKSKIDWTGFIFTWNLEPNITNLLEHGIPLHVIDRYKGFMPIEQFCCAVSLKIGDDISEEDVLNEYHCILKNYRYKGNYKNLGSRSDGAIDEFVKVYPKAKWISIVNECYETANNIIKEKIKRKISRQLKMLKNEIINDESAKQASGLYFENAETNYDEDYNNLLYKCFSSPRRELDSACFVRFIKDDRRFT